MSMLHSFIRSLLEHLLATRGYRLIEVRSSPRGYSGFLNWARNRGLAPATVLDVGVGYGTPWLYEVFPEAKIVLFEPLTEFTADLERLKRKYAADIHKIALGASPGEVVIHIPVNHPTGASLLSRVPDWQETLCRRGVDTRVQSRRVAQMTLDSLNIYKAPFLLKVDVEGQELEVLQGAGNTLQCCEMVMLELSVIDRYESAPDLVEAISFMRERGFKLIDFANLANAPHSGALVFCDAVFVRAGDHRFS